MRYEREKETAGLRPPVIVFHSTHWTGQHPSYIYKCIDLEFGRASGSVHLCAASSHLLNLHFTLVNHVDRMTDTREEEEYETGLTLRRKAERRSGTGGWC